MQIYIGIIVFFILGCVAGTLKVGQSGMVKFLCPGQCRLKSTAVCTFISHGPDHYTRTVLISVHTALCPVHSRLRKCRVIRNGLIPSGSPLLPGIIFHIDISGSVALIVRLVNDKESVFVTELIKLRRIWIVAGTDAVDVVLFH